jgi:hypothetical protein
MIIRVIVESLMWVLLVWPMVSLVEVKADAYTGKEDIQLDGKPTILYQHDRHGALLPFKTFHEEDIDRPKWWNGYGVDPSKENYYYYMEPKFEGKYECYEGYRKIWEGTDRCKEEEKEDKRIKEVPTPKILLLLGVGIILGSYCLRFKKLKT